MIHVSLFCQRYFASVAGLRWSPLHGIRKYGWAAFFICARRSKHPHLADWARGWYEHGVLAALTAFQVPRPLWRRYLIFLVSLYNTLQRRLPYPLGCRVRRLGVRLTVPFVSAAQRVLFSGTLCTVMPAGLPLS